MPSAGVRTRRFWRGLGERGAWAQAVAIVCVVALVGGAAVVALSLGGSDSEKKTTSGAKPAGTVNDVPRSTAGVSAKSVTVVFPVIDISAAGGSTGLTDITDEKDPAGIKEYVREVNDAGGVQGRTIDARIVKFNPLKPAEMRALCKDWTTSGEVFAVVDTGKWYGDNQLCVTEEGHLPLISSWTTVPEWTNRGAPYLWWTGPDQADIVHNLVPWGIRHGLLSKDKKFAILAGDSAGDDLAVNKYLIPALKKEGLKPTLVNRISSNLDDPATSAAQARSAVTRLKSENVEVVIPLLAVYPPFQSYLAAAHAQNYRPDLILSDYDSTVNTALGLAEFSYGDELSGQMGPTVYTLSNEDDDRPDGTIKLSGHGYTPEAKACWEAWHEHHAKPPFIESQGPTMRWCDAVHILAKALDLAGPKLNRRSFVEALGQIKDFPVALTEAITWGPDDHSGPATYRTVRPVKNGDSADTNLCPPRRPTPDDDNPFHGSCWQLVEDFRPLEG
jgi:ABC-type branched-subunit amino acid transport system substrate-binding protein